MGEASYVGLKLDCVQNSDQWNQRWLTKVDSDGQACLGMMFEDDDGEFDILWEAFPDLNGLVPSHEISGMSRTEWFGVRYHGCDFLTLYRVDYGTQVAVSVSDSDPAYDVFEDLFRQDGGFVLRKSEEGDTPARDS